MRVAVSTDSGSGITQEEGRELGVHVVPMPFWIDGTEFYEDINLSRDEFFKKLQNDCHITTSQPSPEDVTRLWDQLLQDHDAVIHIPLTAGLSGATQTALMLSHEERYEGRVFAVDSRGVSITQRQHCIFAKEMLERGIEPARIRSILQKESERNSIYIGVDTLKYLKNGGRITPVAAAIGTFLHIRPVLSIVKGGKLDSFAKVRTHKHVKEAIIYGLKEDLRTKHGDEEMKNFYLGVAYTDKREQAEQFAEELKKEFPDRLNQEIVISPLSLLISCHIGPGGLGAALVESPLELA